MLVEPRGKLREALEHHVGPGVLELLAGAAAGQHADAQHAGRAGAIDVVHVVADVDADALAPEHLGLAHAPDPALDQVDVQGEVVDVALGVGRVLAGDHHDPAPVAAYGGERLVRAGQDGDVGHGVLGVQRPEPVPRRADLVGGQVRGQHLVQRRPELGRQLLDRELDAELRPQHPQHRGEPGHGVDEGHVQVEADRELTGHA